MSLHTLPYDLLLNIAHYLDLQDVHALHLTCKTLYDFSTTRPVYRQLANDLLRRCRALPLKGFQRLSDLTTQQLIRAVNKATCYEKAWRVRAPRPIRSTSHSGFNSHSHYMDWIDEPWPSPNNLCLRRNLWYKVVSAPPNEDVDWLSPITSSYTLCATKSGKVVCWDVQTDTCLAEWNPGERWELWKCRVEFEERTVFFTMAKVISGSYDDERVMEFVLMKLSFPDSSRSSGKACILPVFSHVAEFKTTGVVMNVFLLDPGSRLLAAFVWVASSNTIGLYALLDWQKPEYVFIDTGIECIMSSNWSCILYERTIVIHSEESNAAFQHFYPISLLATYARILPSKASVPSIAARVAPSETITKCFIFPWIGPEPEHVDSPPLIHAAAGPSTPTNMNGADDDQVSSSSSTLTPPISPTHSVAMSSVPPASVVNPNPFPFPPWYPESAHFVRQWWPSLPGIPRVSCTVVLLASHDPETHRTRFVLAQHYFRVPLTHDDWSEADSKTIINGVNGTHGVKQGYRKSGEDALMRLWYVSTPFEVVCVLDGMEDEDDNGGMSERPRPLVAVDFGHAVWIEYVENDDDRARVEGTGGDSEAKWLRFVTFPPYPGENGENLTSDGGPRVGVEGQVHTLEIPDELDLDSVETINIDQSQGAVILSVKEGKIFILCYE